MKIYDFLVIGGGSAGYNAARASVALGQQTAVIDGAPKLGGLCILRGCMPSKTLLYAADVLHLAQSGKKFGLKVRRADADMPAMQGRKRRLIDEFARYRVQQLTTGKFALFRQRARFLDTHTVELANGKKLRARHILVSTGSVPDLPPVPGLAETPCWTSDDVLALDFVPRSVIVLGGGIVA
ncbi:MAG TPA: FAD-dependent oxidoreductase, partial [Opitutaceae bacterium]|nr:FAD-dependent oxidoreductase [Opitutaceae bacterium]